MNVAISVWQERISSVFDFAAKMLLINLEKGHEKSRKEIVLSEQSGPERTARLRQLEVNVLICGVISRPLADMLNGAGIQVLPFVTGSVEQVLTAYKAGNLSQPQYTLSSSWQGARRDFRRYRLRYGRQ